MPTTMGGRLKLSEIIKKDKKPKRLAWFLVLCRREGVGGAGWVASGHWRLCCHSPLTMVGKRPSARYQIGRALDFETGLRDLDGLG